MGRRTHPGIVAVVCVFAGVAVAAERAGKTGKPRLAVADFKTVGDVGLKDAGPFVAELVLGHFDTKTYELLDRARLVKILTAHKLTMAQIASDPTQAFAKKLQGVRYFVVGSAVKLGNLRISARMVDVTTGRLGPRVEVTASATDARDLDDKLKQLAAVLSGKQSSPVYTKRPSDTREGKRRQNETAQKRKIPVEMTLDLGKGVTMKLVLIRAGAFLMGSPKTDRFARSDERPQRTVTITKPFYMGVTEVTEAQFAAVTGTQPWKGKSGTTDDGTSAASYVNWKDATTFCRKLSAKAGKPIRLPTEAEWEYACRAGSKTTYCFGDDPSKLGDYAWYVKNAFAVGEKYAHPVGQKKPNAWGLYDMHGNVRELCADYYYNGRYYSAVGNTRDPKGPISGLTRVCRGGSFNGPDRGCRSACRFRSRLLNRSYDLGFRVVLPVVGPKGSCPSGARGSSSGRTHPDARHPPRWSPPVVESTVPAHGQVADRPVILNPRGPGNAASPYHRDTTGRRYFLF